MQYKPLCIGKQPLIHTNPPEIPFFPLQAFNRNIIMHENFIIMKDINREILCRFILLSLLIMSVTKMRYTVC